MPSLVDQYSRPISARGLFPSPSSAPNESRPRPLLRPNHYENLKPLERKELCDYAQVIYAGVPNINAAIKMKANFAFSDGWHVTYKGTNKNYGTRMEAHINEEFYRDCNVLGQEHDFRSTLKEYSTAMDVMGQQASVFTNSGKVMVFPGTRIGTGNTFGFGLGMGGYAPWGRYDVIKDPKSQFDGARIIDGIIVDRNMVRIGVRIIGEDDSGNPTYVDYPSNVCRLDFESGEFPDQIFGVPTLATAVMSVIKVEDFDYYIKQAMILSASLAVGRKSKDGNPGNSHRIISEEDVDDGTGTGGTFTVKTAVQQVSAGIVELSRDNQEELTVLPFNRPSMDEQTFIERVETGYFAVHWPRQLIYGADTGKAMRPIGQQVRIIVWNRQSNAERFARFMVNRRIAWAMNNGRIPRNDAQFDAYNYEFNLPAEFTTDEANDAKIDLEKLGRSITSHQIIAAKSGHNAEKIAADNFKHKAMLMAKAVELSKKYPDWSPKECLSMVDNPFVNPPQEKPEPKEPKKPVDNQAGN